MVKRIWLAVFTVCILTAIVQAQSFNGQSWPARAQGNIQPGTVLWRSGWRGPPPPYTHPEYYLYLNKRYPKFYGAFHSSYFHNMGLPTGDIGPRGNGIYPTPW